MMTNETIKIFKILSDKTRLEIIMKLFENGEMSCKDISSFFKKLSQPTISHHFKVLENAKIISIRKECTSNFYSLNEKKLRQSGVDLNLLK